MAMAAAAGDVGGDGPASRAVSGPGLGPSTRQSSGSGGGGGSGAGGGGASRAGAKARDADMASTVQRMNATAEVLPEAFMRMTQALGRMQEATRLQEASTRERLEENMRRQEERLRQELEKTLRQDERRLQECLRRLELQQADWIREQQLAFKEWEHQAQEKQEELQHLQQDMEQRLADHLEERLQQRAEEAVRRTERDLQEHVEEAVRASERRTLDAVYARLEECERRADERLQEAVRSLARNMEMTDAAVRAVMHKVERLDERVRDGEADTSSSKEARREERRMTLAGDVLERQGGGAARSVAKRQSHPQVQPQLHVHLQPPSRPPLVMLDSSKETPVASVQRALESLFPKVGSLVAQAWWPAPTDARPQVHPHQMVACVTNADSASTASTTRPLALTATNSAPSLDAVSAPVAAAVEGEPGAAGQLGDARELGDELLAAAAEGRVADIQALLKRGALVDQRDCEGNCALHWAAWHAHVHAVAALLQGGAGVSLSNCFGQTPLHLAAIAPGGPRAHAHAARCVVSLLRAGADPLRADDQGATALHEAALSGNEAAARALLAGGASVTARNFAGRSPLDLASTDALRQLLLHER